MVMEKPKQTFWPTQELKERVAGKHRCPLNFLSQVVKVDAACLKNASISRAHVRK